jgi:protein-disulfide isomerase
VAKRSSTKRTSTRNQTARRTQSPPTRRSQSPPKRQITPVMIAIVVMAAILVVVAAAFIMRLQAAPRAANPIQPLPSTLDYPVGKTPEGYPFKGNPDALVEVVEYSDYQCPFCRDYQKELMPQIDEKLVKTGKVKFIFKDFDVIGDESKAASQAALCAQEQNRFWEYHDILFENQGAENSGAFKQDKLLEFATTLGLNTDAFSECLSSGKYTAQINRSTQEGRNQGLTGMPTTFVNGRKLEGLVKFSDMEAAVTVALGQSQ